MPLLSAKITTALESREHKQIRRRLPSPTSFTDDAKLVDFNSNDYLSLARSPVLRDRFLSQLSAAPDILGSGGSRLLVNGEAHSALEARLVRFFDAPAALLFNSGFDANVALFSCVPQSGDVVVCDEHIHASVHDGIRASRVRDAHYTFAHNCMGTLDAVLQRVCTERVGAKDGVCSVFVAVESVYSMDGTIAPLNAIVDIMEKAFPCGNGYLIVDEAHATGVYGPQGKGLVAALRLESKVLVRLHTFGKALASTGAVVLTSELIRDYLLNYARPLIYTTSPSFAAVVLTDCSIDLLEDGTAGLLAAKLRGLTKQFISILLRKLSHVSDDLLKLPSHLVATGDPAPIVPIMTSQPRSLSSYLYAQGMNARPISWPTVPKGKDRVRVCLHAANTKEEIERLVNAIGVWAKKQEEQGYKCSNKEILRDGRLTKSKM